MRARGRSRSELRRDWTAAALLGLVSSSFSTLVSQLLAARIGRDAVLDWTVVASIPARDAALQIDPAAWAIAVGILFHQWADFSWELFFFGVLGRWTARLGPAALLAVAMPWAVFTSGTEWFFLVPVFPFRQPIFPLEQPWWIGLLVHLSSASMYALFPAFRSLVARERPVRGGRFAGRWGAFAIAGVAACAVLAFAGRTGHELPWMGRDAEGDRRFLCEMGMHHEQGVTVAKLAAARASDRHLRVLARLMAAEQRADLAIFAQWERSWFPDLPGACMASMRHEAGRPMPGMLLPDEVDRLRTAGADRFDRLFVSAMSFHHAGAARMADDEMRGRGDLRLRVMAEAILHAQQGEIAMMQGVHGVAAVRRAFGDQVAVRPDVTARLDRNSPF